jgi:hypothetical protein
MRLTASTGILAASSANPTISGVMQYADPRIPAVGYLEPAWSTRWPPG